MIQVINEPIANIPSLHIVKDELKNTVLPVIIFVHGFTSAKEHNLHFAYLLAEKGFRVILPDALFHGERASDHLNNNDLSFSFWDIVIQTIHEVQEIKEELELKHIVNPTRIGLSGTSMGGIVTLGAITQYKWIHAGVSLMGIPNYIQYANGLIQQLKDNDVSIPFTEEELQSKVDSLKSYDLSLQPEKLNGRPLMFWHGKMDRVVPFEPTYYFYKTIKQMYQADKEKLMFLAEEEAGHKVSRKGVLATVEWFSKHL